MSPDHQRHIGRLNVVLLDKQPIKDRIHDFENCAITTEICRQRTHNPAILRELTDDVIKGLDIGAAKRIDRLLGIAHDKDLSRHQPYILPLLTVIAYLFAQVE